MASQLDILIEGLQTALLFGRKSTTGQQNIDANSTATIQGNAIAQYLGGGSGTYATQSWVTANFYPLNSNPSGYLTAASAGALYQPLNAYLTDISNIVSPTTGDVIKWNGTNWIAGSGGGGGTIYPNTQIVFGDGVTAGGVTSANLVFDGNVFQVTTGGSGSGWGQVQSVVSSSSSEAGLSLYNTSAGGFQWNLISTGNASGIGGGMLSIGNATQGKDYLTLDGTGVATIFGNYYGNANSRFSIDNNTGTLTYYSNDPYFILDGVNRRFQIGDYTYDWYGTYIDINDDYAARSILLKAYGGVTATTPFLMVSDGTGGTTTPNYISIGQSYGTNAAGDVGNVKLKLYDDGSPVNTYGFGISSGLLEIHAGQGSEVAVFVANNAYEAMRWTASGYTKLTTTPTTSGGSYSLLTINNSTNIIESVANSGFIKVGDGATGNLGGTYPSPYVVGLLGINFPALPTSGNYQLQAAITAGSVTAWSFVAPSSGSVTSFSFTNGGGFTGTVTNSTTTPTLSLVLQNATTSQSGQLTSTDWNTFNNKLSGNQTITLSGEATGSGATSIAVTLTNSAVIGKVLTGYVSGAGTVSATDTILQAIQKLNGNIGALTTGVSSVSGTANRITASPTTGAVVVDISSSYVGQSSITTVGTITSGGLGTGAIIGGVTMTLGSDASYDLYYRNSSGVLTRLANGTTGQVLTATTSSAPSWAAASAGAISALTAATATNTINNVAYEQTWNWNSFGNAANGLTINSTSTQPKGAATYALLNVSMSGTTSNGTSGTAVKIQNTNVPTGSYSNNTALYLKASGGGAAALGDYALLIPSGGGNVGIGTLTPDASALLDVRGYGFFGTSSGSTAQMAVGYGTFGNIIQTIGSGSHLVVQAQSGSLYLNNNTSSIIANSGGGKAGFGSASTPTSTLQTWGSFAATYIAKTGNYTLTATDCCVSFNGTSLTATLPAASGCANRIYVIANRNATVLTISAFYNLAGVSTTTVVTMSAIMIISDGTNWQQIQ